MSPQSVAALTNWTLAIDSVRLSKPRGVIAMIDVQVVVFEMKLLRGSQLAQGFRGNRAEY